jgi:subtilisin family serine protease
VNRALRWLLAVAMGLCSATGAAQDAPAGPDQASALAASAQAVPDSRRDIVLAVANPMGTPPARAGSSLLGYGTSTYYGAGQQAASQMAVLKRDYDLREVSGWPIKLLGLYCAVLQPPPGVSRDALVAKLAKVDGVALVQPLQEFSVFSTGHAEPVVAPLPRYNDPYVDLQRGFVATDAASAQAFTQGHGVVVALVDTGVDATHPDLKTRVGEHHDLVDATPPGASQDWHGTEVAGIIAAASNNHAGIVGMAPKASLSVYRACWYAQAAGASAVCNSFTLAKALAAINDSSARVINLSLGGPVDPLLDRMLGQLVQQGRIVIAAMPPDGRQAGFPNDIPGVIVVRTSGASQAPAGVLSAPGIDILTTQPNGGYDFSSGSSMATAHVSGLVALLLSLSPRMDAEALRELMRRTSKVTDGQWQVNAGAAVRALAGPAALAN